jgi:hypothetical protein
VIIEFLVADVVDLADSCVFGYAWSYLQWFRPTNR